MTKGLARVALAALLILPGCAARLATSPTDAVPAAAPKSAPQKPPTHPAAPDVPVAGSDSESRGAEPAPVAGSPPAPTSKDAGSQAPSATESAYVFSPQQAVSASSSKTPTPSPSPSPSSAPAPSPSASSPRAGEERPGSPGELQLVVVASAPELPMGGITNVDVMASSSSPVVDAPLHLTFDSTVVEFVDGAPGDFLTQGGSSVVFLADGLSRPGDVAVAAGRVDRKEGASGSGLLCRVRLRGIRAGTTPVLVGRAKAWGSRGETLTVVSAGTTVVVR